MTTLTEFCIHRTQDGSQVNCPFLDCNVSPYYCHLYAEDLDDTGEGRPQRLLKCKEHDPVFFVTDVELPLLPGLSYYARKVGALVKILRTAEGMLAHAANLAEECQILLRQLAGMDIVDGNSKEGGA